MHRSEDTAILNDAAAVAAHATGLVDRRENVLGNGTTSGQFPT